MASPFLPPLPFIRDSMVFGAISYLRIKAAHPHVHCDFKTRLELNRLGEYSFGKGTNISSASALAGFSTGNYTHIGGGSSVSCTPEMPAKVGSWSSFGQHVFIGTREHPVDTASTSFNLFCEPDGRIADWYEAVKRRGPVTVGSDVWVGIRACILRGVSVGDGAVIGAGAVVTKDVEPYVIVGGVPARPIRRRFSPEVAKQLLEIRWWDWPMDKIRRNARFFTTPLEACRGEIAELIAD
jgi:acetyltransferase-like isoleucine patch superfamily enzyme